MMLVGEIKESVLKQSVIQTAYKTNMKLIELQPQMTRMQAFEITNFLCHDILPKLKSDDTK